MFEFEGKFGIHFFYFILDSFSRTPWGLIFHEAGIIGFPFDIGAAGIPFASPLCLVPVIPVEPFLAFSSFYGTIPYIQVVYFRTFLFGFRFGDDCSEIEIPVRSMLVEESAYVSFFTGYCYCCVAPIRQFITSCCSAVWLVSHHYLSESFVNKKTNAQFHTNWLNMIFPRLLLSRDLLKEDGLIFITIDENEMVNLRKICDEIFGKPNYVGEVIRKTKTTTADKNTGFNLQHDYVLIYARNIDKIYLNWEEKEFKNYSNPDNDPWGDWKASDPSAKSGSESTRLKRNFLNYFSKQYACIV